MRPDVSVLIVTFNGLRYLPELRDALQPQVKPGDELLILDNASDDGTADWIESNWQEATLVRSDTNLLFSCGNNRLAELASKEILFFLNQDTIPDPGVVSAVGSCTQPGYASTVAQQFPWSDGPLIPYLDWSGVYLWRAPSSPLEETNSVSGGAFALHRETLGQIGGVPFDSRLPHYGEDTNLSLRLQEMGIGIVATSEASVAHFTTPSTGNAMADFRKAVRVSASRLLAHAYALGWKRTLARLPLLLAAGYRKANVDGNGSLFRVLGLTASSLIGYVGAARLSPRCP